MNFLIKLFLAAGLAFGFAVFAFCETLSLEDIKNKAEKGDAYCQGILSGLYRRGERGLAKDYKETLKWATHSALQNNPVGIYNMAALYDLGLGVRKNKKEAQELYAQAFPGILKLAHGGDARAQYDFAYMHLKGKGTKADESSAFEWMQKSAQQGCADAQFSMGAFYLKGTGVKKDEKKAFE